MTDDAVETKLRDALRVAQLYYVHDLTMDAIAHETHTSRSTISRQLQFARDSGLVEITVHSPRDLSSRLQREIREKFGVTAHVVPVPNRISEVDRLERVALQAARLIGQLVDSHMTIGIAWGSTLSAIGRHMPQKTTHGTHIVQLNGAANTRTSGIPYAGEILSRFGTAFSAEVHHFPVPALFDDPETKRLLWGERSIRRVLDQQRRSDLLVFGLGSPEAAVPSHVWAGEYIGEADLRAMRADGVVGDVATVFYRADGSDADITINARSSGPDFEVIRAIPRRFCVVSGASKLGSLRGALAAGLITDIALDEDLARDLAGI